MDIAATKYRLGYFKPLGSNAVGTRTRQKSKTLDYGAKAAAVMSQETTRIIQEPKIGGAILSEWAAALERTKFVP